MTTIMCYLESLSLYVNFLFLKNTILLIEDNNCRPILKNNADLQAAVAIFWLHEKFGLVGKNSNKCTNINS